MLPVLGLLRDPQPGFHPGRRLHQWSQDPLIHAGRLHTRSSDISLTYQKYFDQNKYIASSYFIVQTLEGVVFFLANIYLYFSSSQILEGFVIF